MSSDFKPPPLGWSILSAVGGVVTVVAAIFGLENFSRYLHQTDASLATKSKIATSHNDGMKPDEKLLVNLDTRSISNPGVPIPPAEMSARLAPTNISASTLSPAEMLMARQAWTYFQKNWQQKTGLVNSVSGFESVTMWDQAAAIAALVSAKELNLVSATEFQSKMSQTLKTLAKLPLYKQQLPNKVYNSKTLIPVNYGQITKREEIGWSAIDLGRMAIWLKIVGSKYPQLKPQTEAVWKHWQVQRLVKNGQMYGTAVTDGKEQYNQEGRLGYESYAAYGLKLWGLNVNKALDTKTNTAFIGIYGQGVPHDKRDFDNSGANNYVLSEPYILDGIETGFQSLPKAYADRVLAAQEARYLATDQLTAATEDNLDRAPYFVYNSIFVNGKPWANITDKRQNHPELRFLSTKAAIGWHVLYNSDYTQKLFSFVETKLKAEGGWYNGYYETLKEPNKAQTANNNGVVLQSLLYKKVGKPLILWAGVTLPKKFTTVKPEKSP
ncbi:DUF3131 domain-containing protein [Chamaesiphon sp. VAR_48_metabat_135_sub]|uniref:DUF3131 domain-containing protein n=1 Tax=Chamaesiphon sp. VAR_48_metabat_135_sub TaxID=2964699 RepID=UPI00286AA425|nr:DUF3131 domain-containing protein [Chamaesiphon sp. VAR_48_metabat_135_sub]